MILERLLGLTKVLGPSSATSSSFSPSFCSSLFLSALVTLQWRSQPPVFPPVMWSA